MRPPSPDHSPQDADALEALVTQGYRIYGPESASFDHDMESVRSYLFPLLDDWDWQVSSNGPLYAVNTSGFTWAVTGEGATITRNGIDREQNSVFTVVAPDGKYFVSEHYMVGG